MRIIGQSEAFLYAKKGFNMNLVNNGTAANMNEMYEYMKRTKKSVDELTRQEYLMFCNADKNK